MTKFKYIGVITFPIFTALGLWLGGFWSWSMLLFAFVLVPALEFLIPASEENYDPETEQKVLNDRIFDWMLYLIVPIHWTLMGFFVWRMTDLTLPIADRLGMIVAMGIMCGSIGINVAHELGHRKHAYERFLAKALLLSSLYMHFIIEHNHGHHRYVSTPEDPASSRLNEPLFIFWGRSIVMSFASAWGIEKRRLDKEKKSVWSLDNEMIRFLLIQGGLTAGIFLLLGIWAGVGFLISAVIGILLLETINYIEHYGLLRKKNDKGLYRRTLPIHSWNSNHAMGRAMLFELSRHSDHHYKASRKYQVLRHHEESPQMPTGYPGMMLLATIPPLWFRVMNPRVKKLKANYPELLD